MNIVGLDELILDLGKEATLAPERARIPTQRVAGKVRDTMKQLAPRDEGELINSISFATKRTGWGAEAEIGPTATRDGFPYPRAVEFGTSKMAPRPFAAPAADAHADDFEKAIAAEVCKL